MRTPKEFDYDLWKDIEGKTYIRIKETGEICEVDNDTFRLLRNEAMAIYRKQKGIAIYGKENGKSVVIERKSILTLDSASDYSAEPSWLISEIDVESEVISNDNIIYFSKHLTKAQLDVLVNCLLAGKSITEFANEKGVSKQSVHQIVQTIRKKYKKIFL